MAETLSHRGPDDAGAWTDASVAVALGFRRLAIVDLTATGHQPMVSSDGRFVIVFNGEIYNAPDLRKELAARGRRFRGTSDTEVILAGASEWGMGETVPRLWGMFALAAWDRRDATLLLARDRIGKKPLYYAAFGDTFLFGSELKALARHPAFRAEVDRESLALYVRFGYVPDPRTIYRNVFKLPPGHVGRVGASSTVALEPFWDLRSVARAGLAAPCALSEGEAEEHLDGLLRDSVARRMISDVPLGAFLSGGIDSSIVAALMQAQSGRPVRTFTMGFERSEYDEAASARAVAGHLGTDHTELLVTPGEARDVIPALPDLYDEPFGDSSQVPTHLLSRLTRRSVTVALSGDGGDEVFGGYNRYLWADRLWRRLRWVPRSCRRSAADRLLEVRTDTWDRMYGRIEWSLPRRWRVRLPGVKVHKLAEAARAQDADNFYALLASIWRDPGLLVPGVEEPDLLPPGLGSSRASFTERMMLLDQATYLPGDILVKVDRASMGVGLEARAPLLDHRLLEWSWSLPLGMRVGRGQGKRLLRKVLHRYVPPDLVNRPKSGFSIPIGDWLRGPLREWAEDLLNPTRMEAEGYLDPVPVQRAWRSHLAGGENEQQRLWVALMFQAWKRRWLP